jgi:hypothetical protein
MDPLKDKNTVTIDPNDIKTRDYLMLDIIRGVTKSGIQVDRKKQESKNACRKKINPNED